MKKNLMFFVFLGLFFSGFIFVGCSENKSKAEGQVSRSCAGVTCKERSTEKISVDSYLYKTACGQEGSGASFISATGIKPLENQSYALIDLFLLPDGNFQLSYLEFNGTLLTSRLYLSSKSGRWAWSTDENKDKITLLDKTAPQDSQVIATGALSNTSLAVETTSAGTASLKSIAFTFIKNIGSAGLKKQTVNFAPVKKNYGLELKLIEEICK